MIPDATTVSPGSACSGNETPGSDEAPLVMWQVGKIKEMNREFNIAFWQAQTTSARLEAGWQLVVYYLKRKERTGELRFQRSVESFQRQSR